MNILEIKRTMLDKGIPAEVMEQFVFPETEDETPEEKIAFANQMDNLLSKDQILSVMEEQGCNKEEHPEILLKLKDKPIEERIKILNAMGINEYARSRINDDGTLSIFWDHEKNGKYICVCPIINKLSKPTTVSLTYCGCCSGHVKYHFENSLGVKLRLIETVSSSVNSNGEKYCEHLFEIIETVENEYISKQEQLKKVSEETMRFIRGKYMLDEIGNNKDEVAFRDGDQTVLTIYICDGYYDFQVEQNTVRVSDMESLEEAKRMILSHKKPNRKPFPKEQAVLSKCGMRCDLCIHYTGGTISEELREELEERLGRVYCGNKYEWLECPGCGNGIGKPHPCMGDDSCEPMKCAAEKNIKSCFDCKKFNYDCNPQVGYRGGIEAKNMLADDVTWAILPYVPDQYGN